MIQLTFKRFLLIEIKYNFKHKFKENFEKTLFKRINTIRQVYKLNIYDFSINFNARFI